MLSSSSEGENLNLAYSWHLNVQLVECNFLRKVDWGGEEGGREQEREEREREKRERERRETSW